MRMYYFKSSNIGMATALVCLTLAAGAQAQEPSRQGAVTNASEARPVPSETIIPRLVKFSGTLLDEQGRPLTGPVGVTFALYAQQTGGAALWMETQNAKPDGNGNYTVLLGANSANGLPAELFVSGEARWLGIQVGQQPEHERILLVSVPYALKAGDAETLGGLPASAFVTTATPTSTGHSGGAFPALPKSSAATTPGKAVSTPQPASTCSSVTSDGTAATNSLALFTAPCNVQGSLMKQEPINGFPGVGVTGNNAGLLLNGTGTHQVTVTGATSGRLGQDGNGFFFASDTNGKSVRFLTNNGTLNEWMRITSAGNIGIATQTPAAKLDVNGNVNSNGTLTGTQLISTIATGTAPFSVTSTTMVPNLNAGLLGGMASTAFATVGANTFTGAQTISANLTVSGGGVISGSGAGLTNVNAATLSGLSSGAFAQLGAASNVFAGSIGASALQTTQITSGASSFNALDLSLKASDAASLGGNGANVNINAGNATTGGLAGTVNIVGGSLGSRFPGAALTASGDGNILLTPDTSLSGTVKTASTIRMGSETGTAEPPQLANYAFVGLVVRRINSTVATAGSIVARTDTMTLVRDGTPAGFRMTVAAASGTFSIACLGLTSTTTVVGFTDSFANPSATTVQVFNQTDLQQFNCTFGNADGNHVTEVNLIRHPAGGIWAGTVTSTFNQ